MNPEANRLINLSLQEAHVPSVWKQAKILPLLKKPTLDPLNPVNYRLFSLLPILAKAYKKVVNKQLTDFVEGAGLLHPAQSGFRAAYSTESALVEVSEAIRECLDVGGRAALILLDLSAAFDTVAHNLLLTRLADMGISGAALSWLKSFLEGHTQQVWLPPSSSSPQEVMTGVLQGSPLSPLLFNLYITPLIYLAEELGSKIIAYADDTQLLFTWEKSECSSSLAKNCLAAVFQWLSSAQLKCNEDKSEILLYGTFPPHFRETLWPVGFPLTASMGQPTTNLGVWFEENLSFSIQIKKLVGNSFGILKFLRKFLSLLPRAAKETVTRALILSRLDYANALYGVLPGYLLNKLQVV